MELKPIPESILISLSTYPDFQTDNYLNSMVKNLQNIKSKRKAMFEIEDTVYEHYFEPLVYTLWGFWDLCLISIADNSEIITKVIQPELEEFYIPEGHISSKLYSGISFEGIGSDVKKIYEITKLDDYPFIGIVNLKFSSKWHLPNCKILTQEFLRKINKKLKGKVFFPIHTFNTYEISIVILGSSLKTIFNNIFEIREMKVSDIMNNDKLIRFNNNALRAKDSHLFIDSQSYYGARLINKKNVINSSENHLSEWELAPKVNFKNIKAVFEIEAKPGHARDLEVVLDDLIKIKKTKFMKFQTGQYDFYLSWEYNSLVFETFFDELRDKNSLLRKHIRKLKTRLLFDYKPKKGLHPNFEEKETLEYFDLLAINKSLKSIKVSKSLRNQMIKLFNSFQNSFSNKITYSTFIDLFYFVKNIEYKIKYFEKQKSSFLQLNSNEFDIYPIKKIEHQLGFMVATYKDSYYLRYVNDRITDVQDFLIPHNTQLQTIIGFYDSYVKCILSKLIDETLGNSFILTFDEHITEVNRISIKLLSSNLFEPGLIFTALSKEITTICCIHFYGHLIEKTKKDLYIQINNHFIKNPDSDFFHYKDYINSFDFQYGVTDYLRYKYFFKSDFDLFIYYHLGFIVQYPKLYDNSGSFNKRQLFNEVQRILVLNLLINEKEGVDHYNDLLKLYISPEVRSLWEKFMKIIQGFLKEYEDKADINNSIFESLDSLIVNCEGKAKYYSFSDEPDDMASQYVKLSYSFMKEVHKKHKTVLALSRTWDNGNVSLETIKSKKYVDLPYFLFDSQGGSFFVNYDNLIKYSKMRNEIFEDLRYKSTSYKSGLYNKIINEEAHRFKSI